VTGPPPTVAGLRDLGVKPGATLLLHASARRLGPAADTVPGLLLDALGDDGTLVVPAFTAGNSDTSPAYRDRVRGLTAAQCARLRARMPAFDPLHTPAQGVGRLAEAVRRRTGAVRSAHPQTSFAAVGARAAELMAGHDEECHLGEDSPLARLYAAGAEVLLLGVGWEVCTAFHLAEYRVARPPRREYRCVVRRDGGPRWVAYRDVDLDDRDFGRLGADFEAADAALREPAVRHGRVAGAGARLLPLPAAVDYALGWLTGNRPANRCTEQSQSPPGFLD
jgi:aminoglycoside 3-N-acetyltransferase